MNTLTVELPEERFNAVSAGFVYVVGQPDTPEWRERLDGKHFDSVLFTCGERRLERRCVRVFYDPRTKVNKWRIELGRDA